MGLPRLDQILIWLGIILGVITVIIPAILPKEVPPIPHTQYESSLPYSAIVAGSTGAVGRALVKELARSYRCQKIGVIVRQSHSWANSNPHEHAKRIRHLWRLTATEAEKIEVIPIQFTGLKFENVLNDYGKKMKGYEKGFSALGTTMKTAGSPEAFRWIDYNATLALAALMRLGAVEHFTFVSSVGANINSSFTYPQTKGEIERGVSRLGFERVSILRPGVLLTPRLNDPRPLEQFAQFLLPQLHWLLSLFGSWGERLKAVRVEVVAQFARQLAESNVNPEIGVIEAYRNDDIILPSAFDKWGSQGQVQLFQLGSKLSTRVEIYENEILRKLQL